MSFKNPFDPSVRLSRGGCSCGQHASQSAHDAEVRSSDDQIRNVVEQAVVRAIFPHDATRRAFLSAVGTSTAYAAIASIFPLATATELFAQAATPEKKDLKVGFIPITCATPIIMAKPMGFYEKQGLNVDVVKTAGWAVIRDKTLNKEYDAAHMLAPMPLAISLGVGSTPVPFAMPAVENINGQAITLSIKHKDKRDPKSWKGFKFGIPFDYSMHNYLLRYYLAEAGLDPDTDVQIRAVPPPEMVANLRAENIDGFLGPDPFNQRAVYDQVGFIHILSKEIWNGHPCCAFGVSQGFIGGRPSSRNSRAWCSSAMRSTSLRPRPSPSPPANLPGAHRPGTGPSRCTAPSSATDIRLAPQVCVTVTRTRVPAAVWRKALAIRLPSASSSSRACPCTRTGCGFDSSSSWWPLS